MKFNFDTYEMRLAYVAALFLGAFFYTRAGASTAMGVVIMAIYIGFLFETSSTSRVFSLLPRERKEPSGRIEAAVCRFLHSSSLFIYTVLAVWFVLGIKSALALFGLGVVVCVIALFWTLLSYKCEIEET